MTPISPTVKKSILTLANQITIARILFIPVIVILLLKSQTMWVLIVLGLTAFTDLLDGLVARKRGERTQLGAFLDPLADKLLLSAVFLTLTYLKLVEVWVFVVIFSRDLIIVLGWAIIYILTGSANITPRITGKITTTVQMITALAFITHLDPVWQNALQWATVAVTIVSAIDYIIIGEKRLGAWG